jgi:hypothetical protein
MTTTLPSATLNIQAILAYFHQPALLIRTLGVIALSTPAAVPPIVTTTAAAESTLSIPSSRPKTVLVHSWFIGPNSTAETSIV